MKKIIFGFCFLFMVQMTLPSAVFADEIVDSSGTLTPCKVETVMDGLIEYKKNGVLNYFERSENQPVFNDYVDVRTKWFKRNTIERLSGKILLKDAWNLRIRNANGDVDIPFYRVKFIGVYKP